MLVVLNIGQVFLSYDSLSGLTCSTSTEYKHEVLKEQARCRIAILKVGQHLVPSAGTVRSTSHGQSWTSRIELRRKYNPFAMGAGPTQEQTCGRQAARDPHSIFSSRQSLGPRLAPSTAKATVRYFRCLLMSSWNLIPAPTHQYRTRVVLPTASNLSPRSPASFPHLAVRAC